VKDSNKREFEVKPALCLDFDGTIRYSKSGPFINQLEDIVLFPDVEAILWDYRSRGYLIVGITNQAGAAYGYKSVERVLDEIDLTMLLFKRNPFHCVKYSVLSPNGSQEPFNRQTLLRKPFTGMLAACEAEMFEQWIIIDWAQSILVGDRPEDEACAGNAGIHFVWADDFFGREVSSEGSAEE
jgi:D-glycero-D-manno-heptose 1,7-bisphosphate phosphatase